MKCKVFLTDPIGLSNFLDRIERTGSACEEKYFICDADSEEEAAAIMDSMIERFEMCGATICRSYQNNLPWRRNHNKRTTIHMGGKACMMWYRKLDAAY